MFLQFVDKTKEIIARMFSDPSKFAIEQLLAKKTVGERRKDGVK